jgi:hypothetical protein
MGERNWFDYRQGQNRNFLSNAQRPDLGIAQPSVQLICWAVLPTFIYVYIYILNGLRRGAVVEALRYKP